MPSAPGSWGAVLSRGDALDGLGGHVVGVVVIGGVEGVFGRVRPRDGLMRRLEGVGFRERFE